MQWHYIYPICNGTIYIEGAYYMSSQAITHAHGTRLHMYLICTGIMYIPFAIALHISHLQWHYIKGAYYMSSYAITHAHGTRRMHNVR